MNEGRLHAWRLHSSPTVACSRSTEKAGKGISTRQEQNTSSREPEGTAERARTAATHEQRAEKGQGTKANNNNHRTEAQRRQHKDHTGHIPPPTPPPTRSHTASLRARSRTKRWGMGRGATAKTRTCIPHAPYSSRLAPRCAPPQAMQPHSRQEKPHIRSCHNRMSWQTTCPPTSGR